MHYHRHAESSALSSSSSDSATFYIGDIFLISTYIITPHAQREQGKVIGRGVHIYICGRKKNLNRTLEINSPFQTLTVGLLVEFID